jgi:hypothetical protein
LLVALTPNDAFDYGLHVECSVALMVQSPDLAETLRPAASLWPRLEYVILI